MSHRASGRGQEVSEFVGLQLCIRSFFTRSWAHVIPLGDMKICSLPRRSSVLYPADRGSDTQDKKLFRALEAPGSVVPDVFRKWR